MTAGEVVLYIVLGMNAAFWLCVVPVLIMAVIVGAAYRGFFGLPVIVWRGIEAPGHVANLVLKAARTGEVEEKEGDEEAEILDKVR